MGSDILILTIYFICVSYVLYKMALALEETLEDQVLIQLDSDLLRTSLEYQLQQQQIPDVTVDVIDQGPPPMARVPSLRLTIPVGVSEDNPQTGMIAIQVMPQGARPLEPPVAGLTVQIVNTVPSAQVLVDWDSSSLTLQTGQAARVIRQTPGMRMDLAQPQVQSVVNPGQALSATITAEGAFGRDPDTQVLRPIAPLVDLKKTVLIPESKRSYSLELLIGVRSMRDLSQPVIPLLVPFRFKVVVLPDRPAIPVLSWILNK